MSNKAEMMEGIGAKMEADARVHIKNIMMICDNPVGIGEHGILSKLSSASWRSWRSWSP